MAIEKDDLYNSLFGNIITKETAEKKKIPVQEVDESELHPFPNHPFKIRDDSNFKALQESIRKYGIMEPVIVRPQKDGSGYEIISGHRRSTAARKLGIKKIPVIVTDFDDDKAVIMMVDGNKKRDKLDPSELAHALKMRMDAESHRYIKGDTKERTTSKIGKDYGMSERNVSNYIRLAELLPQLLEDVDNRHLKLGLAVDLSYLSKDMQLMVFDQHLEDGHYPSKKIVEQLKEKKNISLKEYRKMLKEGDEKNVKKGNNYSQWNQFFPEEYSEEEKENLITELLQKWQKENMKNVQL